MLICPAAVCAEGTEWLGMQPVPLMHVYFASTDCRSAGDFQRGHLGINMPKV